MRKYEKIKRKRVMKEQVERLIYVRSQTPYKKLIKDFIKSNLANDATLENREDIPESFH